ncbi:helix-turn-helix transcriptional regulator [Sphingomonas sp. 2SG]|uniref:helix-turn-helix transcriptional regulator n=1 Tax=Sphingomonas sp. 2SG TaxID=2502201 RepID=UPI0020163CBB|nr:helix-turn-helix transcriptional regulator [Sphingomonas sp. 2SG]
MKTDEIDDNMRAAIRRLTDGERECLRRCLAHQTAKEMAIDLGVSPHAVEKRLKMARAKLGLSSSLEAARLVAADDASNRLVPETSGLSRATAIVEEVPAAFSPPSSTRGERRHSIYITPGAILMILVAAAALLVWLQASGHAGQQALQPGAGDAPSAVSTTATPLPGTEDALRQLVAGLASGSPNYEKLSPEFAAVVRRDLPMTRPMFQALGELKSVTFRSRGMKNDDVYNLVFNNGEVLMSAALDAEGRMAGGILQPGNRIPSSTTPSPGTEAALRRLVAGLASGSPDYDRLAPKFGDLVRRDMPMSHPMFKSMGELKSITYRGKGKMGDDVYDLVFANGGVLMSAVLDANGRMAGGFIAPPGTPLP